MCHFRAEQYDLTPPLISTLGTIDQRHAPKDEGMLSMSEEAH
jgi:hypothetical protein